MSRRIDWVDASRGMAFMVVIYCHLPMSDHRVMAFFSPVFLTVFFFVSGYLFKSGRNFSEVLEQRVRTLLLPFLALGGVMILLSQLLTFGEAHSLRADIAGLLLQNGENQILWFIAALFVYSLVFYWIDRFCATPLRLLLVAVALFAADCIVIYHIGIPRLVWHVEYAGCACFYMALGKLYRMYEPQIDRRLSVPVLVVMAAAYAGAILLAGREIGHTGSYAVVDSMVITVVGLMLLVSVSKRWLGGSRLLMFVGANTLFYFAFHGKVYSLILAIGGKVAPGLMAPGSFAAELAVAAGVVLLDALILIWPAKAVNRWFPQILGRNFRLWGRDQRRVM